MSVARKLKAGESLSVTELNQLLNACLEQSFPSLHFEGEISQLKRPTSGHLYLTLKDGQSLVSAVMWRSAVARLKFKPEDGLAVVCRGRPNVYPAYGRLQMIVDRIIPAGEGALQQKFLELKAKLEHEGYFNSSRKRTVPFLPKAIGIVTSGSGAVIHDMLVIMRERMPGQCVYLVEARVQGTGAVDEIVKGIQLLNRSELVDLIIIGRGGGSLEELWAFNEEELVKAVFASRIPVISAVGHETDVTLSDLVADVRAPTPTAAAELAVPKRADLLQRLHELTIQLGDYERWLQPLVQAIDEHELLLDRSTERSFETAKLELRAVVARINLEQPAYIVSGLRSKLATCVAQLRHSAFAHLTGQRQRLFACIARLREYSPQQRLAQADMRLQSQVDRFDRAIRQLLSTKGSALDHLDTRLDALSPLSVLERGFAIAYCGGQVVRDAKQVSTGMELDVRVHRGIISAIVNESKALK